MDEASHDPHHRPPNTPSLSEIKAHEFMLDRSKRETIAALCFRISFQMRCLSHVFDHHMQKLENVAAQDRMELTDAAMHRGGVAINMPLSQYKAKEVFAASEELEVCARQLLAKRGGLEEEARALKRWERLYRDMLQQNWRIAMHGAKREQKFDFEPLHANLSILQEYCDNPKGIFLPILSDYLPPAITKARSQTTERMTGAATLNDKIRLACQRMEESIFKDTEWGTSHPLCQQRERMLSALADLALQDREAGSMEVKMYEKLPPMTVWRASDDVETCMQRMPELRQRCLTQARRLLEDTLRSNDKPEHGGMLMAVEQLRALEKLAALAPLAGQKR